MRDKYGVLRPGPAPRDLAERFDEKVRVDDDCHPWGGALFPNGYGAFRVGSKQRKAHTVAWELASGQPVPEGLLVLHTCDRKDCVRRDGAGVYVVRGVEHPRHGHLWLGTHADNHADREDKGRGRRLHGSDNPQATLVGDQVIEIRRRYADGETQAALGVEFGVAQTTIRDIVLGHTWAHLPVTPPPFPRRTRARGSHHGSAILTENAVREIRASFANRSATVKELATKHGVHVKTIYLALSRKRWADVD